MSFRQVLILATVQLVTLLFGMTITIANVVLPQIKGAMSATQDQVAWIITFNLLATAVVTPMAGWLAQRFGWRRSILGAVIGFTSFSLLCGLAESLEALVFYRIGQGLFGAPLLPLGQAILLASFPRHQHPLVIMLWGIGGVVGPVAGPILGGFMAEAFDWRWAFFVIVPFGLLALLGGHLALERGQRGREIRLDWTGFLAIAVAIGAAQLCLDRGGRQDWFASSEIVIEAAVAAIAAYVFIVHTFTSDRPFVDPALLRDRNFAIGLMIIFVMGMLSYTPMVLFPPLLQELRGYPDSVVGSLLAARGIGNWLSFLIVVPFTRWNAKLAVAVGLGSQAVAGFAMASFDINLTSFDVFWTNVLQGFGFGLAYTPLTVLAFTHLDGDRATDGTAIFHMLRNFGSSIFISMTILLWTRSRAENFATLSEHAQPASERFRFAEIAGGFEIATTRGLLGFADEINRQAAMIGYINAFLLFAVTATIATPLLLLMRNPE